MSQKIVTLQHVLAILCDMSHFLQHVATQSWDFAELWPNTRRVSGECYHFIWTLTWKAVNEVMLVY